MRPMAADRSGTHPLAQNVSSQSSVVRIRRGGHAPLRSKRPRATSGTIPRAGGNIMNGHRFRVGQAVIYVGREGASGTYKTTRLMPPKAKIFNTASETPMSRTTALSKKALSIAPHEDTRGLQHLRRCRATCHAQRQSWQTARLFLPHRRRCWLGTHCPRNRRHGQ